MADSAEPVVYVRMSKKTKEWIVQLAAVAGCYNREGKPSASDFLIRAAEHSQQSVARLKKNCGENPDRGPRYGLSD